MQNNSVKCFTVTGKVDGVIQEFVIVNPTNLMINKAKVQGELEDAQGNKLKVTRTMISFPNRLQLIVEETIPEMVALFQGPDIGDGPVN